MVNRLTQFIKNVEKYMSNKANDIDVFNCLFMSLEEVGDIKKKNLDVSGLEQSVVSKIMNGKMDVPKNYLNAAKKITPSDIADSIEDDICSYINEDDAKRLRKELTSSIVYDDYYSNEEKNDIALCNIDEDLSLLIATVFILLLRKVENENANNSQLTVSCYFDGKTYNSLKIQNIKNDVDEHIRNKINNIESLYQKINDIHIEEPVKTAIDIFDKNSEFGKLAALANTFYKKTVISDEVKKLIDKYASVYKITLSDDFYDLGSLEESSLQFPGSKVERRGTDEEKNKHSLIMSLYWEIKDYIYLMDFDKNCNFTHCLKIAINNASSSEDVDIVVKILLPKNSLFKGYDYSFDNSDSSKLFLSLYKKYFEIKETVDYELYKDSRFENIPETPKEVYSNPFFGYEPDEDVLEANRRLSDIDEYEYIDDDKNDIVKINIGRIRKNTTMLLSSPILLTKEINRFDYLIKSNNIIGEKKGTVK